MTSTLVLGTTAQPVHRDGQGCTTPGTPHASWHREDHRVLVETRCPDCGACWLVEVDREAASAQQVEPPVPQWTAMGSQRLDDLAGLPTSAARFAKKAADAGWAVRAYRAWGVEDGQHPYESVGLQASHDEPRVVLVRCWLRRTSTASDSWTADGAWLRWPHAQPLTDAEAAAVVETPTLGVGEVAAAVQPTKRGFTDQAKEKKPTRAKAASAKQREAALGG